MRLFLIDLGTDDRAPAVGDTVLLSAQESHHLLRVLRGGSGPDVLLADGGGRYWRGRLVGRRGGRAEVRLDEVRPDPVELAGPRLELACAAVKGSRLDWAVEKATELGAHRITILVCERGVVTPRPGRAGRWEAVARAAQKQSGRSWRPAVAGPVDLDGYLAGAGPALLLYGDLERPEAGAGGAPAAGAATVAAAVARLGSGAGEADGRPRVAWVVGPEGGWTDRERDGLRAAGGIPVNLGPHRLRTETAAVAGLALLRAVLPVPGSGPPGAEPPQAPEEEPGGPA